MRFSLKQNKAIIFSLFLLCALAYLDLKTGYDLGFFVFYFIPISIIAWYGGRPFAVIISLLAAIAWLIIDKMSGHPYSNWSFPFWNAFVRWTSFIILAIAISQIKAMLENEKKLKQDLAQALEKIKQYIAVAKKIAEGDLTASLPVFQKNEPDSLDETFNFMMKKLSEQKNLENRLFQLERQAIMAEIASYLAHEIRNPLNLISLTAHHIRNQFVPPKEELRNKFYELIESLNSEVEQLSKVVSHFMDIGKQSKLHKVNFPLSDVIDQVHILIKQQLLSKNISIIISGESAHSICADIEQIRLVFLNLIVNAIAAVPHGGSIWIQTESESSDNKVIISISDNGTGIQEDDIEKIFDPYFTRNPDGTGLGLALVRRIIEEHNGTIRAENRREGGARFEIVLPKEG